MDIRIATVDDAAPLAALLDEYMTELWARTWAGKLPQLVADLAAGRVRAALCDAGFIAWNDDYDLHHCVRGASLCDLFVRRSARGRGVAPALIAFACREIQATGGVFLRGTAVASAVKLYARVGWGWDCREVTLGGRAFRAIAALAGASPRELVRGLPDPAWNHEP
ncbi:MAG: GNAT family N-acetyltransferase [Acidobacteriota bacterium]